MSGPMILDVFSEENVPVDIQKIKPIHRRTGSQYFRYRIIDGFVKSPYAALRFKTLIAICWGGVPVSTPHSSFLARLASGAFYKPVSFCPPTTYIEPRDNGM
jgi:hypothetical protein